MSGTENRSIEEMARDPKIPDWNTGVYFLKDGKIVGRGKRSCEYGFQIGFVPNDDQARTFFDDGLTRQGWWLTYSKYDGQPCTDETEARCKGTTVVGIEIYDMERAALARKTAS